MAALASVRKVQQTVRTPPIRLEMFLSNVLFFALLASAHGVARDTFLRAGVPV